MHKNILLFTAICLLFTQACTAQQTPDPIISESEVARVIKTLSADDMLGRNALKPKQIGKAADFIAEEFRKAGLHYFNGTNSYRQNFFLNSSQPQSGNLLINGTEVKIDHYVVSSTAENIEISTLPPIVKIKKGEDFFSRYNEISQSEENILVQIDESFKSSFNRLKAYLANGNKSIGESTSPTIIYLLSDTNIESIQLSFKNTVSSIPMFNVLGVLPGKSKANEYVVFSAHYDHLGVITAVNQDSIANGADDDASGTTAVIELAKYFAHKNDNERTLIFVTFTAEEIGGYGSQYFSKQLNPTSVVAMFNIEMIGKTSKFGKNNAFITGFERSDFGEILLKNLENSNFKFYPDPYPKQNLFYRSDNATLARLGVPAHTISSVQIDTDKLYHSVGDEFETIDTTNITAVIKAIAISSASIISGKDTPSRITGVD